MTLTLSVGGLSLGLSASARVCAAVRARYGAFESAGAGDAVSLTVFEAARFEPAFEPEAVVRAEVVAPGRVALSGAVSGELDVAARAGAVRGAAGLGAVDALVRAALSVFLPLDGALLLHAALAGARVFAGASGAGKSTVAVALGGACDELTVLRPARGRACATPYWQGRPHEARVRQLVCLERGGAPSWRPLSGAAAVRALAPHVVRYVALPEVEAAVFGLLARACETFPVVHARAPEGAAFVPWIAARAAGLPLDGDSGAPEVTR